jgi:hypothetical protein
MVLDNGVVDTLNGGGGLDWFFANLAQDIINNRNNHEHVNNMP